MRTFSIIFIVILTLGITFNACSEQPKLTNLETELLSALIINFQNVAQGSVNPDQSGNVLYLLKHIAHIKATVTTSMAYAMLLDTGGNIVAHNMLGQPYSEGQKLDDEITKKVLAYRDPQKPYIQFYISADGKDIIDISLPVMKEDDETVVEGFVRIGVFIEK